MSVPLPASETIDRAHGAAEGLNRALLTDVETGLSQTPKHLPSRYLYDPLGLALFDAICELPWYGLMRAERRLLNTHARAIFEHVKDPYASRCGTSFLWSLRCERFP